MTTVKGRNLLHPLSLWETAMKTISNTRNQTRTDLDHEVSQFLFTLISASALLLGIWGTVCLLSAFLSKGILSTVQGYFTALTGM